LINANKYAYAGGAGPIEIALTEDHTHLRLAVSDRGPGRLAKADGFGSRIMSGLVRQLGGTLTDENTSPGLRVALTVPIRTMTSVM
jgi:chemotaxis family two-component system sensor kinase Cph1